MITSLLRIEWKTLGYPPQHGVIVALGEVSQMQIEMKSASHEVIKFIRARSGRLTSDWPHSPTPYYCSCLDCVRESDLHWMCIRVWTLDHQECCNFHWASSTDTANWTQYICYWSLGKPVKFSLYSWINLPDRLGQICQFMAILASGIGKYVPFMG